MSNGGLIARYALFAGIATVANLATQRLLLGGEPGMIRFALAVGAGTFAGLLIKYYLDKRWIFFDTGSGFEARKFSLYTVMGVVTTLIFWCTETAFWLVWRTEGMRELGAVIGLGVGYVIKYQLDKAYVFTDRRQQAGHGG